MNCEQYSQAISSLMDGEVPQNASATVFAHLASCGSCRSFFHQLQMLDRSLGRLAEPPMEPRRPVMVPGEVRPQPSLWHRRLSVRYPVAVLAAAVVCAVLLLTAEWTRHVEPMYVTVLPTVVVAAERNSN